MKVELEEEPFNTNDDKKLVEAPLENVGHEAQQLSGLSHDEENKENEDATELVKEEEDDEGVDVDVEVIHEKLSILSAAIKKQEEALAQSKNMFLEISMLLGYTSP